jgi:hypothetical protein
LGIDKVIHQIGAKILLEHLGVEEILANLPAAKRKELERHLAAEKGSS